MDMFKDCVLLVLALLVTSSSVAEKLFLKNEYSFPIMVEYKIRKNHKTQDVFAFKTIISPLSKIEVWDSENLSKEDINKIVIDVKAITNAKLLAAENFNRNLGENIKQIGNLIAKYASNKDKLDYYPVTKLVKKEVTGINLFKYFGFNTIRFGWQIAVCSAGFEINYERTEA